MHIRILGMNATSGFVTALSTSNSFSAGAPPKTLLLTVPSDPLAGSRGSGDPTSKGKGMEGKGRGGERTRREGRKGEGRGKGRREQGRGRKAGKWRGEERKGGR